MKIILAENSGFCFGVKKAIDSAYETVNNKKNNVYSLGPLIHNKQVIEQLKSKGLKTIENIDDVKNGKVIIRSHGVPLNIYDKTKENNIELIDSTCPFVRKVQKKANEYYNKGYQIVIIGDKEHPEVIGINGWCNNSAYIVNSMEDIKKIPLLNKLCIVAQTTITEEKFEKLSKEIVKKAKESKIFNTICNATQLRQESCKKVAQKVDAMIVIGGFHSSNTQKLVKISKKYCPNTYHIETIKDLPLEDFKKYQTVGITAGASTPDWIIKEVIDIMSNFNNHNENMNSMLNSLSDVANLEKGDIVEGEIISVNNEEVIVNIGYKADGIVKSEEFSVDSNVNPSDVIKVGDKIDVYVMEVDDGEGNVLLSKKRADKILGWKKLSELYKNKKVINVKVIRKIKGGLLALAEGVIGFIPISHISTKFVNKLDSYIGKILEVKIIEFNRENKKLVFSRKIVEQEETERKKLELLSKLQKGAIVEGIVRKITNYGAFVDIGGIEGLLHISELSWAKISHPTELINEGDRIKVLIKNIDKENERISLSLKATQPHPWENIDKKYKVGNIVEGKVVKLMSYGAFIELEPGIEGLVHISQISNDHIAKPSEKLEIGEKVKVKILNLDIEKQKISLSIKEADDSKNVNYQEYNEDIEFTIGDIIKSKN
ncbi:bifunctional 4-hydroxy-3-methylbut-2-enyl diphosphate reductase/30S ribosomal protein S1 [Thermohalobacter berrensis]|uniref:4-hydroxy-3-methylbut-2-enyl diphosphate reductase n=1 Tax=Thermohalobacter berrensis TaxID=99594 RepID=A0A419TBE3_9FIRM|nr:bifunctional 4-hydroxy-3-methylbut-2-enyl diphosphate reductase/30S ribosomal protein S1 [Thermohalobacter berrensis]RKD34772.1 4-hydroxy-3-methylbut-2-enyl diphosphate reductase [Thermohalobacter berrensis]